jgi:hypothetical protein
MHAYSVQANRKASEPGADKEPHAGCRPEPAFLRPLLRARIATWLWLGVTLLAPSVSFADSSNTTPVYDTGVGNVGIACAATKSGSDLGCTAKDTSIALVNTAGGQPTCIAAQSTTVNLQLSAQLATSANTRHSLGIYIAIDGKDPSLTVASGGSAACDVFGVPTTPSPWTVDGTNTCGNLTSAATGTFALPHTVTVPCIANGTGPNSGMVVLDAVATWDQSTDTCNAATDIQVGTTSKCKTGTFLIPVIGSLIIKKVAASGGALTFPFTTNVTTPANFTLIDGAQQLIQTNAALSATPQTVSATEGTTAGWNLVSISCVDINGADASSFVTTNLATGTVTANLSGTNTSATCTYTNSNTASVQVTKTVTGAVAGYVAASTFPITVNCGAGHTQTFPLISGGSATLSGIPGGTSCTVSEGALPAPAPNYSYGASPTSINPSLITAVAGVTTSSIVTNTLTRLTSAITINKTVTGAPASGAPGTYNFSANCGVDGTFAGAITLVGTATTGSSSITGIPAGAVCSVSETSVAAAPTNYVFGATPPAVPVTTTAAGPNVASFTNALTRLTSTITLNKTISGGPAGGVAATFGYTANCGTDGTFPGSVTTAAATNTGSSTITGVPAGATCSVAETTIPTAPTNYAWGATPPAAPVTTTVAGPNTASFLNTLIRQTGSLTLTKVVTGPSAGTSQVTGNFTFNVNCGADGTFSGQIIAITGGATNSTSVASVPAGASCTVAETGTAAAPTGYTWNAPNYTGNPATIPVGAAATVTITNPLAALASGSISVAKTIVGGPVPSGGFSITVNCTTQAYNQTQSVTGGNSVVFSGIPTPNSCSVSEGATLPTPPTNYSWNAGNTPPAPQTVSVAEGSSNNVTVTNTLVRDTSSISVTKTVTGGPAGGVSGTFNFSADCGADNVGGLPFTSSITLTSATTGGSSIASVPAGATCTVSETSVPTAPTNFTWGTTPAPVTLTTTAAGPNTAAFTNTLTRPTTSIALNKTVTGGPASGVSGTFNFSADCGADGTFTGAVVLTVATSGTGTISGVPAGASCTVSETSVPTAPASYTWGPTPAPVSVATTAAGPNSASFTNPLTRDSSSIAVTKIVTGGPAGGVSGSFDFSANCATDGTFTTSIALVSATTGSGTITVPSGATCMVSETSVPTPPTFYAWGATPPVVSVTTTTAGPNTASFTNTLSQLDPPFTLTKTVTGGPAGGVSGTFNFSIDCGSAGVFTQSVTLSGATSGSVGISNIPGGSTCVFSETLPLPAAPSGFTWGSTPAAQTVVINGANVAFVNPLNAVAPPPVVTPAPALRTLALAMLVLMLAAIGALSTRNLRRGKTRGNR